MTLPNDRAAADAVRHRCPSTPQVAIILGTGLGKIAGLMEAAAAIPYAEIPGFPCTTALSHAGRLVCGAFSGVPVIALDGRCHLYEGYSRQEVAFPVRVLASLGVKQLILTNASGGLNPNFAGGDILVIDDHIDLMFRRVHEMHHVAPMADAVHCMHPTMYDPALIEQALAIARRENFVAHRGTYVALTGPNYETRAEYRFLRRVGGDAVGMSTVPEVLAAAECNLRVLAVSIITNVARPDSPRKTTGAQVVNIAAQAASKLEKIVQGIVGQ